MIPKPRKMQLTEGLAGQDVPVKEEICTGLKAEEYRIRISPEQILLEGSGDAGLFYARTTLGQLRMMYGEELPCMEIEDYPAYSYRSFQIDCARHYFSVEELKKMIPRPHRTDFVELGIPFALNPPSLVLEPQYAL